ncbi:hypothetical protein FUA48_10865 [Flavobacterium alkalisoli]|uniref:Uncharacterized protein n=2 Tax=Flavobacterium TaxID=237 RepID=A0A444WF73_9FLAO|nr:MULTISPECIES: hypothetical protein [Flavobacterium]QEE50061.1 hypothetical protein FUA48_10865 [Flavobacterium alkalisoli]RYJ44500.1 hypothetical protein NU09_1110 [Flavobacterium beibuense]
MKIKISILSISILGVILSLYTLIAGVTYSQTLNNWIHFSLLIILLLISIIGILLNFEGISIYRNRVRFR